MRIPGDATQPIATTSRPAAQAGNVGFAAIYAASLKPAVALVPLAGGLGLVMGAGSKGGAEAFDSAAGVVAYNLHIALHAYGIGLPPPIRVGQDADGRIGLGDDPRDARFRSMLADLPELDQQLNVVLGGEGIRRAASYSEARDLFLKGSDSRYAQAVVDHYEQTHGVPALSLVYNGDKFVAQEKDASGWRAMKTTTDFMWDLIHESEQFVSTSDGRFDALMKAVSTKVASHGVEAQHSASRPDKEDSSRPSVQAARPGLL